ncbi:MAG: hypothetical protein JW864_11955 [Spirochaetes bacterium]|nr:hypothetical protein [Spirochaetota bacterium]
MNTGDNKHEDFEFDSFMDDDSGFENLFDDTEPVKPVKPQSEPPDEILFEEPKLVTPPKKKRTISDFEPDMDALLMTAQSSMIIEGVENYEDKKFSPETYQIYIEALKGVDLYIKILNRNPNNYRKLKTLIDADTDCQQVEKKAFDLYRQQYDRIPETDKERLEAFEAFKLIFRHSANKASISMSMKALRKYYLISGGIDFEKIQNYINEDNINLKKDINNFHQHLKLALNMLKRGDSEITKGLKGRDLNVFITKVSELIGYYYKEHDNTKVSDYFYRIHNIYKKYFIIKD